MKKLFQAILIIFILILCNSTTKAFDGNRKGFVLSGGVEILNISTSGKFKNLYYPGDRVFTIGFSLGYAFNHKNILAYDRRIYISKHNGDYVTNQSAGFSWSHYFSKQKNSFFTNVGVKGNPETFLFGGGYMFSNNIQIGLTYSHLTKIDNNDRIKLLLSYVAF